MRWAEAVATPDFAAFWAEYRICVLGTVRPDGRPHAVAVGAVVDLETGLARVITRRGSRKVANVRAAGPAGAPVTISQVEAGRWCSLSGLAVVRTEPEAVAEAERRYALRYRVPAPNPERVAIEVQVRDVVGRW
ncbi:MAG TPA: pyridoxamine 5'-phosphate oxidase family protein [Pseudonocardia sp.]